MINKSLELFKKNINNFQLGRNKFFHIKFLKIRFFLPQNLITVNFVLILTLMKKLFHIIKR